MKKVRLILSICLLALLVAACGKINTPDDLVASLEKKEITLTETKMNTYFKLGIDGASEKMYKTEKNDLILIYVFRSADETMAAKDQFSMQFKMSKLDATPIYYTASNVLVVHLPMVEDDAFITEFATATKTILKIN